MKKIVNGLRYDSDKAIEIGFYSNIGREATSREDFTAFEATLYKTPRSGRYFLAGAGGPQTRFAQSAGQNSWTGGIDIIPLTRGDALAWAERYLGADVVETHFGDDLEDAEGRGNE